MDKSNRIKYVCAAEADAHSAQPPLMALVISVMSAVAAEADRCAELKEETQCLAELVNMLPSPSPAHSPAQVLKIQLAALKLNDVPVKNHGVSVAHSYCTPESRALLGEVCQFAQLFQDPMYAPLVGFSEVRFQPVFTDGPRARQRFTVIAADGTIAHYIAHLILQENGPQSGCWLTDSILRVAALQ